MAVKLTNEQLQVVKSMCEMSENFADQLLHIIKNHNLDAIDGFKISIEVDPSLTYVTRMVDIGISTKRDAGFVRLAKGRMDKHYAPTGVNSAEYEFLFADPAVRERMEKVLKKEKELPPDGLWISVFGDPGVVDRNGNWEWDVNDSLS